MPEMPESRSTTDGQRWAYATLPKLADRICRLDRIILPNPLTHLFWSLEVQPGVAAALSSFIAQDDRSASARSRSLLRWIFGPLGEGVTGNASIAKTRNGTL